MDSIPEYGWKSKLDFDFPQKRKQFRSYNFRQILPLILLTLRYIIDYVWKWLHGERPVMDFLFPANCDQLSGVPLGGIGGGTIGRGFRGEFSRYQIIPGVYEFPSITVEAVQFIVNIQNISGETVYQSVLSCQKKPAGRKLSSWKWDFPGKCAQYSALYPRAWTVFHIPDHPVTLVCRQISPIIPNNYKDSSIPGSVFVWDVYNNGDDPIYVSITFTFCSDVGLKHINSDNIQSENFEKTSEHSTVEGFLIKQFVSELPLTYGISTMKKENYSNTSMVFDPTSDGQEIWNKLTKNGELLSISTPLEKLGKKGSGTACGLCTRTVVYSSTPTPFVFSLSWDNPKVKFPKSAVQKRYYTKFFGDEGNSAPEICLYCIDNYNNWEKEISDWQTPILKNKGLPDWYKSALFNELYYVSDGGTIWLLVENEDLPSGDPRIEYGRFGYLEGHEYRMYNTYDVHYYASFALAMLWPKLQLTIQYDFRDAITVEDKRKIWFLYNGERGYRKIKNTVPHDLGDPGDNPFYSINSYPIHDVSKWKDLNLKFVLQVYRDFILTDDIAYVHDMFPEVVIVMKHALTWGTNDDGMIRNSGFPDQTYDAWTMSGVSAYCGSLWIASLVVFIRMAELVDQPSLADEFSKVLDKAKVSFDKNLWNGEYYNFDSSGGQHSTSIMADQLCGLWYLNCCKVTTEAFSQDKVKQALNVIYKMNVCKYYNGTQGAVNGIKPNGVVDSSAVQSEEVWTGVTYGLASLFISEGLVCQGFSTAKGLYETVYEKSGLGFATPEGLFEEKYFRSVSYMRPLSIWSMQLALDNLKKT